MQRILTAVADVITAAGAASTAVIDIVSAPFLPANLAEKYGYKPLPVNDCFQSVGGHFRSVGNLLSKQIHEAGLDGVTDEAEIRQHLDGLFTQNVKESASARGNAPLVSMACEAWARLWNRKSPKL